MKKRRVSIEELKKLKSAVFIYKSSSSWCVEKAQLNHYEKDGSIKAIIPSYTNDCDTICGNSIEEIMVKAMSLYASEKVLEVDDEFYWEEYYDPFIVNLLEKDIVVNEVTL